MKSGIYLGPGLSGGYSSMTFGLQPALIDEGHEYQLSRGAFVVGLQRSDRRTKSTAPPDWHDLDQFRIHLFRVAHITTSEKGDPKSNDFVCLVTTDVLGTLIFDESQPSAPPVFSGDLCGIRLAADLHFFTPSSRLLKYIVNGTLTAQGQIEFGHMRLSEGLNWANHEKMPIHVSMLDIRGKRTAMFGKTRMGKSNVVKLIVQGMLDFTQEAQNVGQLIFDVNGEYANTNPQDGQDAIAEAYANRCTTYFLTNRGGNPAGKLLRFNFYERPREAFSVMRELLPPEVAESEYVIRLLSCRLPALQRDSGHGERVFFRQMRKIMLFWSILSAAGFEVDTGRLRDRLTELGLDKPFNPQFPHGLRMAAYQAIQNSPPPMQPSTFVEMFREFKVMAVFVQNYENDPGLRREGEFIFDLEEEILIQFLTPGVGQGPFVLRPCLQFHSPIAGDFVDDILSRLADGGTVIVDLGGANEQIIRYFAKSLSVAVFQEQERRFVSDQLNGRFIQIYFEEAHMIFPPNSGNVIDVYSRFAKEGAKFNIGIVYSTQSPSTVNRDLLAQTENFFIGHLSSEIETKHLAEVQLAFKGMESNIMRFRMPGLIHLLTYSHRYLVPVQANRYNGISRLLA